MIGAVNILYVYPKMLEGDQFGFVQILMNSAKLIMPFALLGSTYMIVRFFPEFKDEEKGHNGYLPFILLWPLVGLTLFTIFFFSFQEELYGLFKEKNIDFIIRYGIYLLPILYFMSLSTTLTKYISNFHRIVIPAIFNDLFVKVGVPLLCILLFFQIIDFEGVLLGMCILYFGIVVCLLFYTKWLGQLFLKPSFELITKGKIKEIFTYSGYGILGGLGSTIIPFIDSVMVGSMVGLTSAAIYMIPVFMASAIDAPRRAISNITAPLLTESWQKGDMEHIQELYQKTSLNQLIAGFFLFLLAWNSIDHIYEIIPEGPKKETYEAGKYLVLILGLGKVLDMATGVNSEIIGYSKYYRFNFYAILLLAIFTIITNYLLIPIYGIEGAAMATFLSFAIFNLVKFIFLWTKLKLQPFSLQTLQVLGLAIITYGLNLLLPDVGYAILNIIIKSALVVLIFGGGVMFFRISEDISTLVDSLWSKYFYKK